MLSPRWIHCGLCQHLMSKKDTKFYHLSCLDVLCRTCMGKTNRGTYCPVCKTSISQFTELNGNMNQREKLLYHSAPNNFFSIACKMMIFQQKHKQNLVGAIMKAKESMHRIDELEAQIQTKVTEIRQRYEQMRTFRRNLQDNLKKTLEFGTSSQRRMSMTAAPSTMNHSTPMLPERRFSVDAFNLLDSGKSSNSSNDSGIGMNTPTSFVESVPSKDPAATEQVFESKMVPQRRMSTCGISLPPTDLVQQSQRRYSVDTFKMSYSGLPPGSSIASSSRINAIHRFYSIDANFKNI